MSSPALNESLYSTTDFFADHTKTQFGLLDILVEGFIPSSAPQSLVPVFTDTFRDFSYHILEISQDANL